MKKTDDLSEIRTAEILRALEAHQGQDVLTDDVKRALARVEAYRKKNHGLRRDDRRDQEAP